MESNEKRKREIADKQIREKIEKVRLRVEVLERDVAKLKPLLEKRLE